MRGAMLAQPVKPDERVMREVRRSMVVLVAAAALCCAVPLTGRADDRPEASAAQSQLLRQLYISGIARMSRGDLAGAMSVFRVTAEVAPELPQMQYAFGLAQILSDWGKRERGLPAIEKALASDRTQPLYVIAKVLADPRLSELRDDGALYLTVAGKDHLTVAAAELEGAKSAVNGRYLAVLLSGLQPTGDPRAPVRLGGFDRMIGQGGKVRLPNWSDAQAFARLFTVAIPDAQLQNYEPRMVARLQRGLDSLSPENLRRIQMKGRAAAVREQLSALPSGLDVTG